MLISDNTVRRNDLALRLKYTGIKTRIFKMEPYRYRIYCAEIPGDFEEIRKDFDYSIANVGLDIKLTKEPPENYETELAPIDIERPDDKFRASAMTRHELEEYIYGRYHFMDIRKIAPSRGGIDFHVDIYVGENTTDEQMDVLQRELVEVDLGTDVINVMRTEEAPAERVKLDEQQRAMRLITSETYPFTVDEADFWYQNVEQIYAGQITRQDMSFCRPGLLKCFVNASVFPTINIRSLLLLYDTVYLALPIEQFLDKFLESQGMDKKELVDLVAMGKVVLLLKNDEARYDKQLILDAYKEMPDAVVGRRGMNAMLISQLVEMKNRYLNHYPDAYQVAAELATYGNKKQDMMIMQMSNLLAWPVKAVGESFGILQQAGPMAICNFGINQPVYDFFRKRDEKREIEFEFWTKAESAHLAMALDATYFPFRAEQGNSVYSDEFETGLMESVMKTYWYGPKKTDEIQNLWNKNYSEQNMLKLFDTKENIGVLRTARMADRYYTPTQFRIILEKLEKMEEPERKKRIRQYNDILAEASEQTQKSGKAVDMLLGCTGFLPLEQTLSMVLNVLGMLKGAPEMMPGAEEKQKMKELSQVAEKLGVQNPEETAGEVYLLDRISPVAILR